MREMAGRHTWEFEEVMFMAVCDVCFRCCSIPDGGRGFCGGRTCADGRVIAGNYGKVTALALDPIEKKPLNRFYPGRMILSVGSYGCNLRCPFCQNHEISWSAQAMRFEHAADTLRPEELVDIAVKMRKQGNIGLAFTYNEPLIGWEFVRDTARLSHDAGLVNVMVTNGTAQLHVLEETAPYIDAMNIDLKGFTDRYYSEVLGGSLAMVKDFISHAVRYCHVELTTLIVPGENDSEEEMRSIADWIAGLKAADGHTIGTEIPLHISRFFPRFHMTDRPASDVGLIYHLADAARDRLRYVYTGNC